MRCSVKKNSDILCKTAVRHGLTECLNSLKISGEIENEYLALSLIREHFDLSVVNIVG